LGNLWLEAGLPGSAGGLGCRPEDLEDTAFNPQAGFGAEVALPSGRTMMVSLRSHHISNGGLDNDNRGVNGVLLTVGWLF